MTLAQLIRNNRLKLGISQFELAQKLGVSQAAIGQWEREVTAPRSKHIPGLAKIFNIDVSQVVAAADELQKHQQERAGDWAGVPLDNESLKSSPTVSAAYRRQMENPGRDDNDRLLMMLADHGKESRFFDDSLFELLSNMGVQGKRNVRIEGRQKRTWVVDYASEKSIIEVKHLMRTSSLQLMIPNLLWTLSLVRAVVGSDHNFVALLRLPAAQHGDQKQTDSIIRMKAAIELHALDAALVGLKLRAVDTVEEAAKWIVDIEQEDMIDLE